MIYRLHCHSIVGCEESPVTAVAGAGLPAGGFVSVTASLIISILALVLARPSTLFFRSFTDTFYHSAQQILTNIILDCDSRMRLKDRREDKESSLRVISAQHALYIYICVYI